MTTRESDQKIHSWLEGRLPDDWFESFTVMGDREEITIVGDIPAPDSDAAESRSGRIRRFREETRQARIAVARELEASTGRKVTWGAACGETTEIFTRLAVPVMTRLAQPQRLVLDTLVESGVARSRSDAVAWCVRLVAQHQGEWLTDLDTAMTEVRRVREEGPTA